MAGYRVGTGFDIHKLIPNRRLFLGGVEIDYHLGLEGHSDGDSLIHAVIDALLGAAALGDIGMIFPPSDPSIKDINSLIMLDRVGKLIRDSGFAIENIDATIICESPKLSPHYLAMRQAIAKCLNLDLSATSIKATTMEKLGPIGQGEAIAAQAVAMLRKNSE